MKGNLKQTIYETKQMYPNPEGISMSSNSLSQLNGLNLEERNQNTVYQYNEMLKNTIDFSESLNNITAKQEEDMFFGDSWQRKEIDFMKTKSRQKLVDLFRTDEGFECAISFGNDGSTFLNASDHDYSHPLCLDETRSMDNGSNGDDLRNAILGNQFLHSRLPSTYYSQTQEPVNQLYTYSC